MLGIPTSIDFFHIQKCRTGPEFWTFFQNRPCFLKFYSRTGSFLDNLVSNVQIASCFPGKLPVQSQFSFKKVCLKDAECVPVIIIISKWYSNKVMLPVGAVVSCSLMLSCSCKKIALIQE